MKYNAIIATIAAASAALAATSVSAQETNPRQVYGNLGYTFVDGGNGANLGVATGRIGAKLGRYLGVEGEAGIGVDSDRTYFGSTPVNTKLKHSFAGYGVGYLPLTQQFDLFGRVGYGTNRFRTSTPLVSNSSSVESWNYGGGVQYNFDQANGLRAEYTRYDFNKGRGEADTWGLSYVRKF